MHIWSSRHHADHLVHEGIIDHPYTQKYNLSNVKHRFQIHWYCKLQSIQNHILGCWKLDFNKTLLTYSKTRAIIESMDGPAGQLADNLPNSGTLVVSHWTVPELIVRVDWQPRPPIWQRFWLDPDTEPLLTLLMGTCSGLDHQEAAGLVIGQVWNRTELFLQSKSGPLVGYPDPLLTLLIFNLAHSLTDCVSVMQIVAGRQRAKQLIRQTKKLPGNDVIPQYASLLIIKSRLLGML